MRAVPVVDYMQSKGDRKVPEVPEKPNTRQYTATHIVSVKVAHKFKTFSTSLLVHDFTLDMYLKNYDCECVEFIQSTWDRDRCGLHQWRGKM